MADSVKIISQRISFCLQIPYEYVVNFREQIINSPLQAERISYSSTKGFRFEIKEKKLEIFDSILASFLEKHSLSIERE